MKNCQEMELLMGPSFWNVPFCLQKWTNFGGQPRFQDVGPVMVFAGPWGPGKTSVPKKCTILFVKMDELRRCNHVFRMCWLFLVLAGMVSVARCFRVLQGASVPAIINNHLFRKKRNDKVKTLGNLSLVVTRQQMQVTIPNWVDAREECATQFLSYDYQ